MDCGTTGYLGWDSESQVFSQELRPLGRHHYSTTRRDLLLPLGRFIENVNGRPRTRKRNLIQQHLIQRHRFE